MSELLNEIKTEVKDFLDNSRYGVYREISRTAIFNTDGVDIEVDQSKMIGSEELDVIRANGASSLATAEWFNDVEWIENLPNDYRSYRRLLVNARYPMEYFDEEPKYGMFSGGRWLDQYGAVSGYGSRDEISSWSLQFVDPDSRSVKNLQYPKDSDALDQYNARYKQYLEQLDSADSTVAYYQGFERGHSKLADKKGRTLGGLSLGGVGVFEVLHKSESATDDIVDVTRVRLNHRGRLRKYSGRSIEITGDEAMTEPYFDGEDDRKVASEKLLVKTLKLVKDLTKQ